MLAYVAVNRRKGILIPNRDCKKDDLSWIYSKYLQTARHTKWRIQPPPPPPFLSYHHHLLLPLRPPRPPRRPCHRRRRARRTQLNSFPSLTPTCCRFKTLATALFALLYRNPQHNARFRLRRPGINPLSFNTPFDKPTRRSLSPRMQLCFL